MTDPFPTTRWSVVLAAQQKDTTRARGAMEALCEAYWFPLYAFVRRRGFDADQATDLTQAFFVDLIEGQYVNMARQDVGRFRAFLLHKVKQFLGHERERAQAKKRGGEAKIVRFETQAAELRYGPAVQERRTPEQEFERRWAQTVVDRALDRLERDAADRGRSAEFELLRGYLTGDADVSYSDAAARLEMSETAVKSAVHRLRKRLGEMMREEIAETVADPGAVDNEMRNLLAALE